MEAEGDESSDSVNTVQITYVDPQTGKVTTQDVFCDPQDWEWRWQSRFLISSNLVNLLSDAQNTRHARFRHHHGQLSVCRHGYFCDLWRLRRVIERVARDLLMDEKDNECKDRAASDAEGEDSAVAADTEGEELCPVHFYMPEYYIDSWTLEHLAIAVKRFTDAIQGENRKIKSRIRSLGGNSWLQMLDSMLKGDGGEEERPHLKLAPKLMDRCNDDARKKVENTVTGGLRDQFDDTQEIVDGLSAEFRDYQERHSEVEVSNAQLQRTVDRLSTQLQELLLKIDPPEAPVIDESEARRQLEERIRKLFEIWEDNLAFARARLADAHGQLATWEAQAASCDAAALRELEKKAKAMEQKALVQRKRVDGLEERAASKRRRSVCIMGRTSRDAEKILALQAKVQQLPPPDPRRMAMLRLEREMQGLRTQEERVRRRMLKPLNRVRAIRNELRSLYKKLKWEWDLSDSEDDAEDKPYWERRKIATAGLTPFDASLFLFAETPHRKKKLDKLSSNKRAQRERHLVSQFVARRTMYSATDNGGRSSISSLAPGDMEPDAEEFGPFADSEAALGRALRNVQRQLIVPRDQSELPKWVHDTAEVEWRCTHMVRLQEIRASLEKQIQQCAACFVDLLPEDGGVGDARQRLVDLLEQLQTIPADPSAWGDSEVEQKFKDICNFLQEAIRDVIAKSDQVGPICAGLQHSVRFGELRSQLDSVTDSQLQMQAELRQVPYSMWVQSGGLLPATRSGTTADASRSPSPEAMSSRARTSKQSSRGKAPSPLEASDELVLGTRVRTRQPHAAKRPDMVDFGFRPGGGGEESLEGWSLFKVSKTETSTDSIPSRGNRLDSTGNDPKVARYQRMAADCDFHQYMSLLHHSSLGGGQKSASTPDLLLEKNKRCPSLPQLIKASPQKGSKASLTSTHSHQSSPLRKLRLA